jgi:uncharacterized protein YbjQ (UPF0145 family)
MRGSILLACALSLAACDPVPRDASNIVGETSTKSDDAKSDDKEAKGSDDDEVAEDRAIMADKSLDNSFKSVKVLQNDQLGCSSEVMGLVDIHMPVKTEDEALEVLKRKAAKLGAPAVINVEFHHGEPGAEPTHLSGMAVRCHDLFQGRKYDVIEKIDVVAEMGKEDDGDKELIRRAAAMGADLVMDIEFEHGDGEGKPTHARGTAIRFRKQ